jgi:hypothetical protein
MHLYYVCDAIHTENVGTLQKCNFYFKFIVFFYDQVKCTFHNIAFLKLIGFKLHATLLCCFDLKHTVLAFDCYFLN